MDRFDVNIFSCTDRMGEFKGAFIEGLGKSTAYAVGGILFLIILGLLAGFGIIGGSRNWSTIKGWAGKTDPPATLG